MIFFEVFEKSSFTDLEQKNLIDVNVKKITADKSYSTFTLFLCSKELLPYKLSIKIKSKFVEDVLLKGDNKFDRNNINVKIDLKYNLSDQYSIRNIFDIDKEYILREMADNNRLLYVIFRNVDIKFNDNKMIISVMSLGLMSDKAYELKEYLISLFKNRYGKSIDIEIMEDSRINNTVKANIIKDNENKEYIYRQKLKELAELKESENKTLEKKSLIENKYRKKEFYDDDENIFGKIIDDDKETIKIKDIDSDEKSALVKGTIIAVDYKMVDAKDMCIITFTITDDEDSIRGQHFIRNLKEHEKELQLAKKKLAIGDLVLIKCSIRYNEYYHELMLTSITNIKVLQKKKVITIKGKGKEPTQYIVTTDRLDYNQEKRVELHLHTKSSDNDAVGAVEDYIEAARKFEMKAMAITDHGCVQGLADAYTYIQSNKYKDLKIINGVEAYLVDDELSTYMNSDFKESNENVSFDDEFIVLDIIQSGSNTTKDKIIKINALKIKNRELVDSFSQLADPHIPLTFETKNKTGLRDEQLVGQQDEKELLTNFLEFAKDSRVLVNHIPISTITFLKARFKQYNITFDKNILDLSILARTLNEKIKKIKLDNIVKQLKIKDKDLLNDKDRLDALKDIFLILVKQLKDEHEINNTSDFQQKFKKDNEYIKRLNYYHIILLAKNDVGRVNLYKLVSDSYTDFFYKKPKMPRSLISKYREGIIVGSACIAGEFMDAIKDGRDDEDLLRIASFYDYLEIQPAMNNSFLFEKDKANFSTLEDLQNLNKKVVEIGELMNKPVVATCDSHYVDKDDKIFRTILKYGDSHKKSNENNNLKDEKDVVNTDIVATKNDESADDVLSNEELYFRTTDEMLTEFDYLGKEKAYEVVIKNTNLINNMIENDILPIRLDNCPPVIENSDNELRTACYKKFREIYGDNPPKDFADRLDMELNIIIDNGYSVMYISAKRIIDESINAGYLVGSRGSVGSSFAANMAGISEINPLPPHYICPHCKHVEYNTEETNKYYNATAFDMPDKICPVCGKEMNKDGVNIPFETFLGVPGGEKKEPDIDLNFATEYQSIAHDYTRKLFGEDHVFKSGTISTYKDKNAFGYVKKYCEGNNIILRTAEKFRLANGIVRVKKTTGQHPGGMIVVPNDEEIYTFVPVQYPGNDAEKGLTTHFDYHKIDKNLLKLDMLGHDTPSILKRLYDLTNVNPLDVKFYDNKVMELFKSTKSIGLEPKDIGGLKLGTLSVPEFGTTNAMKTLLVAKPQTIADLIRISGLSHGENVWQGNAEEIVKNNIAKLEDCVCCRDDIMLYLSNKGMDKSLAFNISEKVRKGKGLTEEFEKAMQDLRVPDWYIDSCKKIKYMFPKAHAAAYVITALRIAYYKIYFPAEYYAAFFSVKTKHLDYELMCTSLENVRFNLQKNKNADDDMDNDYDLDDFDQGSEEKGDGIIKNLKVAEEMLARGITWLPLDINRAKGTDFIVIDKKIMPSFVSITGLGEKKAMEIEEERKSGPFTSVKDFYERTRVSKTIMAKMRNLGIFNDIIESDEKDLLSFI